MDDYNRIEPATTHPTPEPGVKGSARDKDTGGGGGKPALTRSSMLPAALAYARKDVPVFPLVPRGKKPIIPKCRNARGLSGEALARHARGCRMGHGLYDATTDEGRIREWWNRWPDANIGVPTGERSGLSALDVDSYKPGAWGPDDIAAQLGPIPATLTARSGRGGGQFIYRHPPGAIRNGVPEDQLGPGVGIKADGGYIVVPPSVTVGPYKWIDSRPPAEAPDWFVAALTRQPRAARGASGDGSGGPVAPPSVYPNGPPIPEGIRNDTMIAIAGRLHDGSRGVGQLEADLAAINAARCEPPLPGAVVRTMARNIHALPPCRAGTPAPDAETRAMVDGFTGRMMARAWPGQGEKSDRSVCRALVKLARLYGVAITRGVRVSVSLRDLALFAGVSKVTVIKAVRRLRMAGIIRKDDAGRWGTKAGAFVLLTDSASLYHSSTSGGLDVTGDVSGKPLRYPEPPPLTAPGLRHSAPIFDGPNRVGTILRPGPGAVEAVDHLEAAGGTIPLSALAAAVNVRRPWDLRRRRLRRLETAGVVECSGDTVSLTPGWIAALEREREIGGEIAAHKRDAARYEREREAFKAAWARGDVVSRDELQRRRLRRAKNPATPARPGPIRPGEPAPDGVIGELERLPMGETPAAPARSAPPAPTSPQPRPDPARPAPEPGIADAVREVLRRWPERRNEKPSWFATTIWAYDLLPQRPPQDAVASALSAAIGSDRAA